MKIRESRREEDMKYNKGCKLDFNLPYFKFNFAVYVRDFIYLFFFNLDFSTAELQQSI